MRSQEEAVCQKEKDPEITKTSFQGKKSLEQDQDQRGRVMDQYLGLQDHMGLMKDKDLDIIHNKGKITNQFQEEMKGLYIGK